ncbi:MAG: efflux RND transporter periplasmic adaptor subunit [Acidobacteriota bacterium]
MDSRLIKGLGGLLFRRLFIISVIVGFLSIVGFRLYQELGSVQAGDGAPGAGGGRAGGGGGGAPALLVETAIVETRQFKSNLEVMGELRPVASVEVMSRISGRLEQVLVDRGQSVRKGQLLVVVEDSDIQQQISRSEAAIEVARAAQAREKARYDNLRVQLERYRKLHHEGLVSTQDLEDIESRARVAQSEVALQEAQVSQAEAALREMNIQQSQTRIYSPLDGIVGTRYLDPGALVSPSVAIVSVLDLSRVKTVVPISGTAFQRMRPGLPAEIVAEAYPDRVLRGSVTRISPFLDPETRSAEVEIEIPNVGGILKPGMFAQVIIDASVSRESLSVPRSALLTRGADKGVYILSDDQATVFQTIEIGRIQGDSVEVLSGLQEGATIVATGAQNLNDGDPVKFSGRDRRRQ